MEGNALDEVIDAQADVTDHAAADAQIDAAERKR